MRRTLFLVCILPIAFAQPARTPAQRLAQWKQVAMPFHSTGLSPAEISVVDKLVDACRLLDNVYYASDLAGLALYKPPKTRPSRNS